MTKQLILKDLSKLVQKYTTKQGVLIQSLPQDEIFEYPKSDTTVLYRVKGVDIPIIEKTPPQAPPLPLSLLMDLKKYLKDTKSKEIINQYIEQTKQQQLDYVAPIRPIEEEKKKAQKTIEKEKVKEKEKEKEKEPLALKATEKALKDMTEIELREFFLRKDILISDRNKAIKLYKKLQEQPPKEPSKEQSKKVIVLKQIEETPTKQELEVQIEDAILQSKQPKEGDLTAKQEDERNADIKIIKEEIQTVSNSINNKVKGYGLPVPIIAFKTYDEFLEYKKTVMPFKEKWLELNLGNPSFFTTAINRLEKTVKDNLKIERKMTQAEIKKQAKLAEQKRLVEEAEAKALKVEQGKQIVKKKKPKTATETK